MRADILVIGGGVIGLSIARELARGGVERITLLERGKCGGESSWAAAGMLGVQAEADEGGAFLDLCGASRDLYPSLAADLLDETGIDIGLDRSGTLYLAFDETEVRRLRKQYEWQTAAGLEAERLSAGETLIFEPNVSPDVRESLFFPNDWQVDNRKLCAALRRSAEMRGVEIIEGVSVQSFLVENGRVTGVQTDDGVIGSAQTIAATGAWTSLIKLASAEMPFDVRPIRGQMIAFQSAERFFQRVIYSSQGYLVPRADGRILAGSTSEDVGYDSSVTKDATEFLRAMAAKIAPVLESFEVADRWAGLRPAAPDNLPVLGEIAGLDGLFIASAHYRNGILLAPITARLTAEFLTNGSRSEYFNSFGPDRFARRGVASGC